MGRTMPEDLAWIQFRPVASRGSSICLSVGQTRYPSIPTIDHGPALSRQTGATAGQNTMRNRNFGSDEIAARCRLLSHRILEDELLACKPDSELSSALMGLDDTCTDDVSVEELKDYLSKKKNKTTYAARLARALAANKIRGDRILKPFRDAIVYLGEAA